MTAQPPLEQPALKNVQRWLKAVGEVLSQNFKGFGYWICSILGVLALPCLPLIVEWVQDGRVSDKSILLVSAVLAASLIFTAETLLFRMIYGTFFIISLMLETVSSDIARELAQWSGTLLALIASLHTVVWDRPFPDTASMQAQ